MKMAKGILSLGLILIMLMATVPVSLIASAAGENDTTLSQLYYTFNGQTYSINLVPDDINSALQENRYSFILPYVTKTYTADRLPQVYATAATEGATAAVTQISAFPGSAKIIVTASDNTTKRNYYIRFKYQPGEITMLSNSFAASTGVTKSFYDFQPLSLTELRELFSDVGQNWEEYNLVRSDRALDGIAESGASASATYIPSTGDYITSASWHIQWITKQVSSSSNTASSTYFNGASRIISPYAHRNQSVAGDWMTFSINRGATIWVIGNSGTIDGLPAYRDDQNWIRPETPGNFVLREAYSTAYGQPFYRHFDAGNVTIPKTAGSSSATRPPLVMVMWDAPGSGDTSLASLTTTVNGNPQTIDLIPGETNYRVIVPAGSDVSISAMPTDSEAEMTIKQAASPSEKAYIDVASGQNTKSYTVEFSSMSSDASLKSLSYSHSMIGNKSISLTTGTNEYSLHFPYGISNEVPQISAEANNGYANISVMQAQAVPGSAYVLVTAEDGTVVNYTVHFSKDTIPPETHQPGNITNLMTRYQSANQAYDTPQSNANVYVVNGSTVVPVTNYALSTEENPTPYLTNQDRINVAMSTENPYYTNEQTAWSFGDRVVTADTTVRRSNTQYTMVEGTSPILIGSNVTKILTLRTEADFTLAIPDLYAFNIDKNATIYVASQISGEAFDANYSMYGWKKETNVRADRGATATLQGEDGLSYAVPAGVTGSKVAYSKRYLAGANVTIPSRGMTSGALLIFVVWDECNPDASLSEIAVNGEILENFSLDTNEYEVELPLGITQVPDLAATPSFYGAEVEIINATAVPGTATINILAADGVTTKTYTINYKLGVPAAPSVSADDITNQIVGFDAQTMEYAISNDNGESYGNYIAEPTPALGGNKLVKVRIKEQGVIPAGHDIILTFTVNYGDVDGDGFINVSDVIMTAEIAVGYTSYTPEQVNRANVSNKVDKTVDVADVVMILERVTGIETVFPIDIVDMSH